jgi:hypothetical protein
VRSIRASLVGIALSLAAGAVASADGEPSQVVTFVDQKTAISLTLEIGRSAPDFGHFVFRVPGLGQYVGEAGSSLRRVSAASLVLDFVGDVELRPLLGPDGTTTGSVETRRTVRVTLRGQIDPAHSTAEATLWDAGRRHHLVSRSGGLGDLLATTRAVESAFIANDPRALYPLVNGDIRAAYTMEAFATSWAEQSASIGRVTSMRRTGFGEPQVNPLGFVFVVAGYDVDRVTPFGTTETVSFEVFFVREGTSWKLLFSRAR